MNVTFRAEEIWYLQHLQYLNPYDISTDFHNSSLFRISLYALRERLLIFIERVFTECIRDNNLTNRNIPVLRRWINHVVRNTDPFGKPLKTTERQGLIQDLRTRITANWDSVAKCYTGRFVSSNFQQRQRFRLEEADPKDLLEILKNCSLFSNALYATAYDIIGYRNRYYGHLPLLLIDSLTLSILNSTTESLTRLISA